ncbi:hypothetical protein EDC04DRAFT_2645437 [Pisolithus marmoratus]|nr:hypothetical protein EDC04DRAFT_2645437 [Pisolithus marmoratus]
MDEINQARAELAQLESVDRGHLHQVIASRRTIDARGRELTKMRDPTIHRLPVELLVLIFSFVMVARPYHGESITPAVIGHRRQNLASVSRRWRDVILTAPTLWRAIYLTSQRDRRTLMSQLKRSQGVLFDITITEHVDYFVICKLLPYLRPTMNRWRSLHIWNLMEYPNLICELSKSEFPSLHLTLRDFIATDDFSITNPLKTLELTFDMCNIPPSLLSRISNSSLITLCIVGDTYAWALEPNSIHFPLLEELSLCITHTEQLLAAIIAPKLQHFDLAYDQCQWDIFGMLRSKFSSVHHLELMFDNPSIFTDPLDGVTLCQAFPNTRHAEFSCVKDLLSPLTPIALPENSTKSRTAVDSWANLEKLSIHVGSRNPNEEYRSLVRWLETRQEFGLPKLHIKLRGIPKMLPDLRALFILRSKLRSCCILEFDGQPLSFCQ